MRDSYLNWPKVYELWSKHGLSVVPIKYRSKEPCVRWQEFQARKPTYAELEQWFVRDQRRNVAIVTGPVSGVVVLDIDSEEGEKQLLEAAGGELPRTVCASTGRGRHYYFRHPGSDISKRTALLPGVDFQGDGGLVIAPPSVHESGKAYEWIVSFEDAEPAPMPAWLVRMVSEKSTAYGKSALARETEQLSQISQGDRNNQLNISSVKMGNLIASGELDEDEAVAELVAASECNGYVSEHGERATMDTIKSGMMKGKQRTRHPLDLGQAANDNGPTKLNVRTASDITPERVNWLWEGVLPRSFCLIGGDPGVGKSQVTASIAAIVSSGGTWPVTGQRAKQGNVIILATEDDPRTTIVPRLIAAGANLNNVSIIESASDGKGERTFDLSRDIPLVQSHLEEIGGAELIIVDPVTAYLGDKKVNDSGDVRGITEKIARLAHDLGTCVIGVQHLNKTNDRPALYRFMGSMSWVGAARMALLVDQTDKSRKTGVIAPAKGNLGPDDNSIGFTIEPVELPGEIKTSRIVWNDHSHKGTADKLLIEKSKDGTAISEAIQFLQSELADGPVPSVPLKQSALEHGISAATYRDAYERLGVKFDREKGAKGKWFARLPQQQAA